MTTKLAGRSEAMRLAFTCFTCEMAYSQFAALPMEEQLEFAEMASLDAGGLICALQYMSAHYATQADSFRKWNDERKSDCGLSP